MADFDPTVNYRDVPGFPGYRVGDDGSVWSCWVVGANARMSNDWHRLTGSISIRKSDGYKTVAVGFRKEGRGYSRKVGRLILEAFVGPCPPGRQCAHDDGDTTNNRLTNLAWKTPLENTADKRRHGTQTCGENHSNAKLSDTQLAQLRTDFAAMPGNKRSRGLALGPKYGVAPRYVEYLAAMSVRAEPGVVTPRTRPGYRRGDNHPASKITETQVETMRADFAAMPGLTCPRCHILAARYGVSWTWVYRVVTNRNGRVVKPPQEAS